VLKTNCDAIARIPECYAHDTVAKLLVDLDVTKGAETDGLHDDPGTALDMFMTDPNAIRYEQRATSTVAAIGKAVAERAERHNKEAKGARGFSRAKGAEASAERKERRLPASG
jgi:hypothetical protein